MKSEDARWNSRSDVAFAAAIRMLRGRSFLEKKLRAKENATLRNHAQREKLLQEQYDHLQKMIALETDVHEDVRVALCR